MAGLGAVPRLLEIFARLDPRPPAQTRFEVVSHPEIFDGVRVHQGQVLAVIRHNARVLLSCERVILNLMQHLSGIATLTRKYVDAIQGTHARVLDTRKTVPGLRAAGEIRRAMRRRNQSPHRSGLRHPDQEQPHFAGRRPADGADARAGAAQEGPARAGGSAHARRSWKRRWSIGAEAILLDNMTPAEEVKRSRGAHPEGHRGATDDDQAALDSHRGLAAALCLKTSAPMPRPAWTLSAWARSPTRPRPPTSP